MKYKLSGTRKIPKDKAATFGFKTIETDDIKQLVKFLNTHAVLPCKVKGGHRLTKNVKEIYPWIRLDVDLPGEAKKIDKALKDIKYIKKPSTSNAKNPYKWHYYIPIKNVSQNYDAYKLQYWAFLKDHGIELHDKALASVVQNTNPMGEEGIQITHVNGGKGKKYWTAPDVKVPKRKKSKKKHSETSRDEIKKILALPSMTKHVDRDKRGGRKKNATGFGYEEFLKVGMALYDWCPKRGFKLYKKWAEDTGSYYAGDVDMKWTDFARNLDGNVSIGSLIHMAHGEKKDLTEDLPKGKKLKIIKPGKSKKKRKKGKLTLDELPGQMNKKLIKNRGDQVVLFDQVLVEGMHSFIYGAAGSMKTTTIAWIAMNVLENFEKKKVHFWSFDAAQNHEKAIYDFADDPRMMLSVESTADDYYAYYEEAIENEMDLSDVLIIVDTFKFISSNVNDKNANKKAMHFIKELLRLGASCISLGHTNKDGIKQSGTAEIEQDSDAILRIDREVDPMSGEVLLTISAAGRARFNTDRGVTFHCTPVGEGYDYLKTALDSMEKTEFVDLATGIEAKKAAVQEVMKYEEKIAVDSKGRDANDIKIVKKMIKSIKNNDKISNSQEMLYQRVHGINGMAKPTLAKLLTKYNGTMWNMYKDKNHKTPGRPSVFYKVVKNKKP